ncbi:tRNA pseudouridine(13) synthase TruD [Rheinheimera sp.]|uniref:tRNA pseudouridine(13) synthase TruD n=1 Tax=Rheinheimera sp. TaxID=1869214 RepID=UPI003AF4F15B
MQLLALPYLYQKPQGTALLRVQPDDFIVEETLSFTPTGAGEHLLLFIEKIGQNTQFVAKLLAEIVGCKARQVSYAGLKDRHAVTRQWFCVPYPIKQQPDWQHWQIDGCRILQVTRHQRRLRLGAIAHNTFHLRLRDVSDPAELEQRLQQVKLGVPNYYGEQRFGRDGGNLVLADKLFQGGSISDRQIRGLALSAARSFLFNTQLARRLEQGLFNRLMQGEVVQLDGSGSIFKVDEPDDVLRQRLAEFDIHPTAALAGCGEPLVQGDALEFEQQSLHNWQHWVDALIALNMRAERRSIRLVPRQLNWYFDGSDVCLSFQLYSGCFATSVLRELVNYQDVQRHQAPLD